MELFPKRKQILEDAGFRTATDLLEHELSVCEVIKTGDSGLDDFLGEGIVPGTLTELVGEAGSGKSQFCMTVTASCLAKGLTVIYMDTEKSSSLRRMEEMFRGFSETSTQSKFFNNLILSEPLSIKEMVISISQLLEQKTNLRKAAVLIIDSIAYFFRGEARAETFHDLDIIQRALCQIACEFGIAVIITNHVTSISVDETLQDVACMGQSWRSVPTTRIWLARRHGERYIRLEKCPWRDRNLSKFVIKDCGIVLIE